MHQTSTEFMLYRQQIVVPGLTKQLNIDYLNTTQYVCKAKWFHNVLTTLHEVQFQKQ